MEISIFTLSEENIICKKIYIYFWLVYWWPILKKNSIIKSLLFFICITFFWRGETLVKLGKYRNCFGIVKSWALRTFHQNLGYKICMTTKAKKQKNTKFLFLVRNALYLTIPKQFLELPNSIRKGAYHIMCAW